MDFTAVKKDQLDPDFKLITDIKGKKKSVYRSLSKISTS